jgi:hypothetical protein
LGFTVLQVNLAGELSPQLKSALAPKYIGPLSRMQKKPTAIRFNGHSLSVPEPQRDLLNNVIKTLSGAVGIH